MSTTLPMKEVGNLISSPEFPNAVQWAADGTLAVAEGNGITLLNPSALNGPRSFCAVEAVAKDAVVEAAGGVLKTNQGSSIHHDLAMSSIILSSAGGKDTLGSESGGREKKDSNSQSKKSQVAPRAIAWSPPGAGPFGSSLLAAVLTDHRILVYGPQRGASPEWKELASLHDDVVNYMANESGVPPKNVRHVPSPAPSPSPDDPKTNHLQSQRAQPSDASDPENVESVQPRKPEVQVQVQEPEEEPTEQAGLAADPSPEPLTKQQAAMKTVSMFFTLRRNLPASEIPVYPTPSSHLKDGDLSCLKQAMDTVWTQHCSLSFRPAGVTRKMFEIESRYQLRLAWDRYNNVAREGYEEVVGLQGPGGSSCHPALDKIEKENGETTESEDEEIVVYARNTRNGRQRRQRASVQVPKRLISWLDLPPVNPQSAGDYKRTLINGAVKRFLLVRADGEEPAVRYRSSSQHLKAEDVALLEGVVEEYAEAFAEAFVALNLDKANFQQLVTVQLRKMWDRVTGKYIPPDLNIQETARDAFGSTVSNENDGPPVVPTLRGASHGLSGGGVRGRGGGRGKARGGGSQQTPFERGDQPANRLCTSAHEYERRLLSLSSISCAWSPILGEEVGLQCSLLAVGTKEGRVWLWRYCHGRNDARADEFDDHFNNRFTFLGCCCSSSLDASSGAEGLKPREIVPWSSALDWVGMTGEHGVKLDSVILVIGRSDGSVALLMCKVDDLQIGNVQIDPNVFHQLDTVALGCKGETKVLQAVTCVCAKVVCGGTRLVVAVAGVMGIVSLWVGALKQNGQECVLINQERVYSCPWLVESASIRYSAVTGLCMTCPPETDDDSWDLLILACNREGSLACWRLPCDRIQSLQGSESIDRCESPVACFKRVKPYREVGFGTFGIAASPGGGFIATARCALPKGIDIIKQLQVWQRLTLGYAQLYRTIGPSSARPDALKVVKACCEGWACRPTGPLPWDIVNVGIKALDVDPEPLAALWESVFLKSLDQCRMPLSIPDTIWRLLMSAVALRHASGSSQNNKDGGLASNRYELLLLQRQAEKVMVSEDREFSKFSKLAAAEFVFCLYSGIVASSQQYIELERPFVDLVPLAMKVHREVTGRAIPAGDFQPVWREVEGLEGVESKMSNGPFTNAVITAAVRVVGHSNREQGQDEEVTIVPRCPASFLPVVGSRPYSCRLCLRTYAMQAPCCVVCGFAVGLSGPDFLFLPP